MSAFHQNVAVLSDMPSDHEEESAASAAAATKELVRATVDEDGDLLLMVGTERLGQEGHFKVCSATLRRSSVVLKAMLFGGHWAESKPAKGEWIVKLPEDNPSAIGALLAIAHGRFELVPHPMEIDTLYEIIVVCDKYAMMHLLRPWIKNWMKYLHPIAYWRPGQDLSTVQFMHAAIELGCEMELAEVSVGLVLRANEDQLNNLRSLRDEYLEVPCGLPDLVENIASVRRSYIQDVLDFWYHEIDLRADRLDGEVPGGCQLSPKPSLKKRRTCNLAVLGVLMAHLARSPLMKGGIPRSASKYAGSLEELLRDLGQPFSLLHPAAIEGHSACSPDREFKFLDRRITLEMSISIAETGRCWERIFPSAEKKRLAAKREKTGA